MLALIAFTSLTTWGSGLLLRGDRSSHDRWWVAANVMLNLGILCLFKYYDFFQDSLLKALHLLGINADWPTLHLLLPVGISFYTFQAISYTIDVYRGDVKATRDPVAFGVFIAFFPQLVAGPIERAKDLLPQFLRCKSFDYDNAVVGMRQIIWGLAKKLVIADTMGRMVDPVFRDAVAQSPPALLTAGLLFAVQIYADFSGYSDIAIGSARLLNIRLTPNFRYPFFSRDLKELWQRWHITLMAWFRNYVYFPLGGSRCGRKRACVNIMVVFALSGLWHGANWTYVIWGIVNGLLLLPFVFLPKHQRATNASWRELPQCLLTFILFALVLIIFRAEGLHHLNDIGFALAHGQWTGCNLYLEPLKYVVPFFIIEWVGRRHEFPLQSLPMPRVARWTIYWGLLWLIAEHSMGINTQFIYFQF